MLELATIQYIFFSLTLNIGVHRLRFISRREHMWRNHMKDEFKRPLQLLCIDLSSSLVPNFHICNVFVTYLKLTYPALHCKLLFCNFYCFTFFFLEKLTISIYEIDKKELSRHWKYLFQLDMWKSIDWFNYSFGKLKIVSLLTLSHTVLLAVMCIRIVTHTVEWYH